MFSVTTARAYKHRVTTKKTFFDTLNEARTFAWNKAQNHSYALFNGTDFDHDYTIMVEGPYRNGALQPDVYEEVHLTSE